VGKVQATFCQERRRNEQDPAPGKQIEKKRETYREPQNIFLGISPAELEFKPQFGCNKQEKT
jgi:hypothetical protein